ncbi:uncharacterized protein LOC119403536 [Rhipicephalus sanguineus]|uniref:uncharacterized protein LOC119403536 n=1 Tax=Rhipicephalus sanguineus TaxID=34632 RepID=UPI0020C597CA|nr:uncharacterized protein LOC119403536 [Rhipicephalus sanguineus]
MAHDDVFNEELCYLGGPTSSKTELKQETELFQVNVLDYVSASEQRLETLRAATSEDPALVLIREYAQTSWPDNKQRNPEPARPYWAYREEVHAQDGLVFRSNKRLMGRQTRTLLPVPTEHLEPETIPSKDVHDRLQVIRRQQKASYDRNARNLRPLMPGQRVTTYDTL